MKTEYKRKIYHTIVDALENNEVIFLFGCRKSGKTHLVHQLMQLDSVVTKHTPKKYISLDSTATLLNLSNDPTSYLRNLDKPLIIDEIKNISPLLNAIKVDIQDEPKSIRYVLTSSTNIQYLNNVPEQIEKNAQIFKIFPLSINEIEDTPKDCIKYLYSKEIKNTNFIADKLNKENLFNEILLGGFPECRSKSSTKKRALWFDAYLNHIIERDCPSISRIQDNSILMRLLMELAVSTASIHNQTELSRRLLLPNSNLTRYLGMLEALFLIWFLPAWTGASKKKLAKAPKMHFIDSGLACHLAGIDSKRIQQDVSLADRLLETFIAAEFLKQSTWTEHPVQLYHYRPQVGEGVQLVLQDTNGKLIGIQTRQTESLSQKDWKALLSFKENVQDAFHVGILLYFGNDIIELEENIYALPFSILS